MSESDQNHGGRDTAGAGVLRIRPSRRSLARRQERVERLARLQQHLLEQMVERRNNRPRLRVIK